MISGAWVATKLDASPSLAKTLPEPVAAAFGTQLPCPAVASPNL